jgi:hypothetical protein
MLTRNEGQDCHMLHPEAISSHTVLYRSGVREHTVILLYCPPIIKLLTPVIYNLADLFLSSSGPICCPGLPLKYAQNSKWRKLPSRQLLTCTGHAPCLARAFSSYRLAIALCTVSSRTITSDATLRQEAYSLCLRMKVLRLRPVGKKGWWCFVHM